MNFSLKATFGAHILALNFHLKHWGILQQVGAQEFHVFISSKNYIAIQYLVIKRVSS